MALPLLATHGQLAYECLTMIPFCLVPVFFVLSGSSLAP